MLHKQARNIIKVGVTVADNARELSLKPIFDNFGQRVAIKLLCGLARDAFNILCAALDFRGEVALRYGADIFDYIADIICICNHNLVSLFTSEIFKFGKHLLGVSEKQRRLHVRVLKALPCLEDSAKNLVTLTQEMHVAGGNHFFSELFAEPHYFAVKLAQTLIVRNGAVAH